MRMHWLQTLVPQLSLFEQRRQPVALSVLPGCADALPDLCTTCVQLAIVVSHYI
jgi:hypothetical protein